MDAIVTPMRSLPASFLAYSFLAFPCLAARALTQKNEFQPDRKRMQRLHAELSATPRVAGTAADQRAADWFGERFLEAGLKVETEDYEVYLSRPVKGSVALVGSDGKAKPLPLGEQGFDWDSGSFRGKEVPPYIAYAANAKLRAEVVYAHYGRTEDYAKLAELGVDVRGRIVLVRYGKSFRGVKLALADKHGAAAVLLYTDPQDSGWSKGDVYPRGKMAPESAVQRGSALYIWKYPGDPLTPGKPAVAGIDRINEAAAQSLPRIAALPLSYKSARPILASLGGAAVPQAWQGALPFTYHTGPGSKKIALEVENRLERTKIRNVFGVLEGKNATKGDFILVGNHRDSWLCGAIDPASGGIAMLEAVRMLAAKHKAGWKPERTIRFASWGAEEFGVIGSTEYGERHVELLRNKLLAYINADAVVSGSHFSAASTPALRNFARELAWQIKHPDSGQALARGWNAKLGEMGGGSDFMVFLARYGCNCISFAMHGSNGVYHSAFDTHWFMRERIDAGFRYHASVAQLIALAALRLSSSDSNAADPGEANRDLLEVFEQNQASLPAAALKKASEFAKENVALAASLRRSKTPRRELLRLSRHWLDKQGLFGRPWFQNLLLAPGRATGYAAVRAPGIKEALEDDDEDRAASELTRLSQRLKAMNLAMRKLLSKKK